MARRIMDGDFRLNDVSLANKLCLFNHFQADATLKRTPKSNKSATSEEAEMARRILNGEVSGVYMHFHRSPCHI